MCDLICIELGEGKHNSSMWTTVAGLLQDTHTKSDDVWKMLVAIEHTLSTIITIISQLPNYFIHKTFIHQIHKSELIPSHPPWT